ncbi:hypothetical protein BKA93DRAFT_737896 [Sparassis latifolia]
MITADGPGMTHLNGLVGHQGAQGCHLYCLLTEHYKVGGTHHYLALLKLIDYVINGCDHNDVSFCQLSPLSPEQYLENLAYLHDSPNDTQYKNRCKQTGIVKPSILYALTLVLTLPSCCALDLMHLTSLNIPDLLIPLF